VFERRGATATYFTIHLCASVVRLHKEAPAQGPLLGASEDKRIDNRFIVEARGLCHPRSGKKKASSKWRGLVEIGSWNNARENVAKDPCRMLEVLKESLVLANL
jgi:hypothetical protein